MVSPHQSRNQSDQLTCPSIAAEVGEDPARFLDQDETLLAESRIRGIVREDRLDAFLTVETTILPRYRDEAPRREIIQAINLRRATYFTDDHSSLSAREWRDARPMEATLYKKMLDASSVDEGHEANPVTPSVESTHSGGGMLADGGRQTDSAIVLDECPSCGSGDVTVERHGDVLGTSCECVLTTLQLRQSAGVSKAEVNAL